MFALRRLGGLAAILLSLLVAPALSATQDEVTPLVSTQWLAERLDRDDLIVLDIRSGKGAEEAYLSGHVPGALRSEYPGFWRTDRGSVVGVLPSVEKLEAALSELGVAAGKTVVIVPAGGDSGEFGAAARIYWTLKYLGHDAIAILDGGHRRWVAEGRPLESGPVAPTGDMFIAAPRAKYLVSTQDVASRLATSAILVDGRPLAQFVGKEKHAKATRLGHIPGAVSHDQAIFYDDAAGRLKPLEEIARLVPQVLADKNAEIVSYCNTGHWAATNWFVLSELLGYTNVSLYDDSMVGWSQDEKLPMATDVGTLPDIRAILNGRAG